MIKAWDLGVASMKVGEVCQLICKPEYAYGQAGSPPSIPPCATLLFEVSQPFTCLPEVPLAPLPDSCFFLRPITVGTSSGVPISLRLMPHRPSRPHPQMELFAFHGEDVTEDEDGGVVKRIITRGGGHAKPSEGSPVQGEAMP